MASSKEAFSPQRAGQLEPRPQKFREIYRAARHAAMRALSGNPRFHSPHYGSRLADFCSSGLPAAILLFASFT